MENPLLGITVNLDSGIIFVNGVPDCFLTPQHAREHFESWANVLLEINVEGDAYANTDSEDGRREGEAVINYSCFAWQ
jgi:hypothetical protein